MCDDKRMKAEEKKLKDSSDIYKLKRSVLGRALSFSTCESIFGTRHAEKSKCPNWKVTQIKAKLTTTTAKTEQIQNKRVAFLQDEQ